MQNKLKTVVEPKPALQDKPGPQNTTFPQNSDTRKDGVHPAQPCQSQEN